ncbi:MAG: hypothetical protein HGA45_30270, partial [Chloroflexales bacterium]|nr:hypothetical protein [Chloroflexales bacterium]
MLATGWAGWVAGTAFGTPAIWVVWFLLLGLGARSAGDLWRDASRLLRRLVALGRSAPLLSSAFVRADFDFYRGYLRGVKEPPPRWKRCVARVDRDLGEALGQVFVERTFPPEVK